jgi:hypothetical protein
MSHVSVVPEEPVQPEFPPVPDLKPPESPPTAANGFSRVQLTSFYTQYLPKVPRDYLIQQAARILAERAGVNAAPRTPSPGQGGLIGMWKYSQDPTNLQEEISFDEAALLTPMRPTSNSSQPPPGRASLGFKSSDCDRPIFPLRTESALQSTGPQPVPWPLGESGKLFASRPGN